MIALSAEPFRTTGVNPRVHERNGPTRQPDQTVLRPVREPPKFRSALRNEGECGEFSFGRSCSLCSGLTGPLLCFALLFYYSCFRVQDPRERFLVERIQSMARESSFSRLSFDVFDGTDTIHPLCRSFQLYERRTPHRLTPIPIYSPSSHEPKLSSSIPPLLWIDRNLSFNPRSIGRYRNGVRLKVSCAGDGCGGSMSILNG